MPGRPHLDGLEARFVEHIAKALGVVPPRPEAQHAEDGDDEAKGPSRLPAEGRRAPARRCRQLLVWAEGIVRGSASG